MNTRDLYRNYTEISRFTTAMIMQTFDGIIGSAMEQEKKLYQIQKSVQMPPDEFSKMYITEIELREEVIRIFPFSDDPQKSQIDIGMPYIPPKEGESESPSIFKETGYTMANDDYETTKSSKFIITSKGYKSISRVIAVNLATQKQFFLNLLLRKGVPRVCVDNGRILSKVNMQLVKSDDCCPCDKPECEEKMVNGLQYKYYEGVWNNLPDFEHLTPVKVGVIKNFDISEKRRNKYYGFVFYGFIDIKADGEYTFYLKAIDGGRLYVDNKILLNNDTIHELQGTRCTIYLKKGKHHIIVMYFNKDNEGRLEVKYSGPEISKGFIPDDVLYRNKHSKCTEEIDDFMDICDMNSCRNKLIVTPVNLNHSQFFATNCNIISEIEVTYKTIAP